MYLEKIILELRNFYNLPYCFTYKGRYIDVILGDHSSLKQKTYTQSDKEFFYKVIEKIQGIMSKKDLSVNDKIQVGRIVEKLILQCEYKIESLYTLKQQRDFLQQFDNDALEELYTQIMMYKAAVTFYQEYIVR